MATTKYKQKLMKHRVCVVARAIACVTFLVLTIIGVSSLVRAMSLDTVEHQNGIPAAWKIASLGQPESITVPITYWDQRQDDCNDPDRQFEWTECRLYAKGIVPDVVKSQLGADGLPVPTYDNNQDAWAAYHDVFTANVIGHDPVLPTDNFYRWFHETPVSKRYDREVTFNKVSGTKNSYTYGSHDVFPLDNVDFSNADNATKSGHNFHFTAHLQIPMKISADGSEEFHFLGDDDVWVFLNGQLVLDLGGLHMETAGWFKIDANGNVQSTVENVNADQACRQTVANPTRVGFDVYNSQLENKCARQVKTTTIPTNFEAGDVVNLDFFYAERSTTESNTTITITNMNWPISADSDVNGKIVGKLENSDSNLIEYTTSVKNRDPQFPLQLNRISTFISDESTEKDSDGNNIEHKNIGFLPHSAKTLYYTTTPNDENSWQPVEISAPTSDENGFTLKEPITMSPAGQAGDTLHFRFIAETSEFDGNITNRTSYYTTLNGVAGVTYDNHTLAYKGKKPEEVKQPHHLKINYIIDWGEETPDPAIEALLPDTYEDDLKEGETYNVPTKLIDNFTPDQEVVNGTMPNENLDIVVKYTKNKSEEQPKPKYTIRIQYLRSDTNAEVAPEYNAEHTEGYEFVNIPKDIDGFTKDTDKISFIVDGDKDIIVYYTPNPKTPDDGPIIPPFGPITPSDPDTPDEPTPEEPTDPEVPEPDAPETPEELPTVPIIPGDDDLIFLPPLGEVAFVPNTGVISEYIAPIFEQHFASVVLSQGFILTTLLLFSGSFAVYFSLRKYLNFTTNAYATVTTKKMPKKIANSKTARNMQKAAKKASKTTTAKTTRKTTRKKTTK